MPVLLLALAVVPRKISAVGMGGLLSLPVSFPVSLLMGFLLLPQPVPAQTAPEETVLEKVARTGKLVAGTRTDAVPLAFKTEAGDWRGYSVDLLERIRAEVSQTLRKPVQLEFVPVTARDRMSMLVEGDVDIVCGVESFTRSRAQTVDFSISYFITGTQLMINPANTLGSDFTIGVVAGTTNQQLSQRLFQIAQFVEVDGRAAGLTALKQGRIDAFAGDGILLEGMRQTIEAAATMEIMPNQYDQEQYACMLPQGNLPFEQAVDAALLSFMQGVLDGNSADLDVIDTWFGEAGLVPIDLQPLLDFFQKQVDSQPSSTNSAPSSSELNDRTD